MSSLWNNRLSISLFGESHSAAIGVVLDGLPAGVPIDFEKVQQMMLRRQAKSDGTTTSRVEPDVPEVLSGYYNGVTTGTSATTFSPDNDCTRAQIVTFLYRYMG